MMIYSYDKLWKLLIDRKITKTEMRQQTGIGSTSGTPKIPAVKSAPSTRQRGSVESA